ncbi:hypothetical protein Q0Z83_016970 [Actinoplanes sichuanensis]|nr:hypothetical protein Q0Z83_016970 [Actinoplanes sichuanensis]
MPPARFPTADAAGKQPPCVAEPRSDVPPRRVPNVTASLADTVRDAARRLEWATGT